MVIFLILNYFILNHAYLNIIQVNLDLATIFSSIYFFFHQSFSYGFTLLFVGLVYQSQLKVLNRRFTSLVGAIKACKLTSGRHTGSELAYYWVAHRKLMVSFDRLNGDLFSLSAASLMAFITPYNIYLLTSLIYTTSTSGIVIDKVSLVTSLSYQIVVISLLGAGICALVEKLHKSAKAMHGLQLCLHSDQGRTKPSDGNSVCEQHPLVAVHTKWKLLTHYELVHTEQKHFFTIGPMKISKKFIFEVSF